MNAAEILGESGLVAANFPGYEERAEQLKMADAVAEAFRDNKHLIVEAGTGVGKSFAYLVPAIETATRLGVRVVISTNTIALQEQLIQKDIPFLQSIWPSPFSAVLVKGRANYIGLRRLARSSTRQRQLFDTGGQISELHAIEDWAYETSDGSRSDLSWQPTGAVWERVNSDSNDCFGRKCPHYQKCFFQRARRKAMAAQLLIVNHAMLFSDLAVRQQGASILPDYDYVVLDEGHTIERVAAQHLGVSITEARVRYLLNGLHNSRNGRGLLAAHKQPQCIRAVHEAYDSTIAYFADLTQWVGDASGGTSRVREAPPVHNVATPSLLELRESLHGIRDDVQDPDARLELEGAVQRCTDTAAEIHAWHAQGMEDWVYWLDVGTGRRSNTTLHAHPIDVGPALREALYDKVKSVVLTSATLTTSGKSPFSYIQRRTGLCDTKSIALGSPFDYPKQLTVYVEADMPDPSDTQRFITAACARIERYVLMTEGRAFVLFTSYEMLRTCALRLQEFFAARDMQLLVQGADLPRSQMLERFRAQDRSVLFGTESFWAGVDVPGKALSNVIITKLPFAVPNHPLIEARIEQIKAASGNAFMEFQLPEAVLKFRQGVGRLIRTKTDKGIVVILDPRIVSKRYGKLFLAALPECEVVIKQGA